MTKVDESLDYESARSHLARFRPYHHVPPDRPLDDASVSAFPPSAATWHCDLVTNLVTTRQTDATRQSTTSIQREAPQRVARPMALLPRRSHIPRTSSVSTMLATRSVVSREPMGDSPSCRQDHELILKVPDRSRIRTATACSVGFLKVPQVALQPPKARSALLVWSSLPSLHRSAVSRRVVRCNDPYITPGGIWAYLRWGWRCPLQVNARRVSSTSAYGRHEKVPCPPVSSDFLHRACAKRRRLCPRR